MSMTIAAAAASSNATPACAGNGDDLADRALEDLATEWRGAHGACRTEGEPTDRGERRNECELAPQLGVDLPGDGGVDAGLAQGRRERLQSIGWPFWNSPMMMRAERAESLDDSRRRAGGADVREAAATAAALTPRAASRSSGRRR